MNPGSPEGARWTEHRRKEGGDQEKHVQGPWKHVHDS